MPTLTKEISMPKHKEHHYKSTTLWTGAGDKGTKTYQTYQRTFDILIDGKPTIKGSSDPAFLGNPECHNPEDMFVASVSSCHMLWFLHLCSMKGVMVKAYKDQAEGFMTEEASGKGYFTGITLNPQATLSNKTDVEKAQKAHHEANEKCFIANSLNFKVKHTASFNFIED